MYFLPLLKLHSADVQNGLHEKNNSLHKQRALLHYAVNESHDLKDSTEILFWSMVANLVQDEWEGNRKES